MSAFEKILTAINENEWNDKIHNNNIINQGVAAQ